MTPPPVDVGRNLELIAERLGWPDGTVAACAAAEADHPLWSVYWSDGAHWGRRGYRANLNQHGWICTLQTATVEELDARMAAVEGRLPAPYDFPKLMPLI